MSNGLTLRRELAELLVRAGVLRQHRDPVALVDQRALLGDEVHPVEHRVDHQHVVVLVGGDGLLEVVAQLELDRHPVGRAVAVVHDRDERLDALQVLGVLGHVGPRGHELGHEGHALGQLGVLLEEQVEGAEAAQHVLREVGAVHAQDEGVAAAAQQLALELLRALRRRHRARRARVDRQRVAAHPHLAVRVADDAAVEVDLEVHQVAAALQEVAPVALGVEADDVVGQQARVELLADAVGQDPPRVGLRPRDVDEVVQEDVGTRAAHERRQRVEVVVVHHHHGLVGALDLLDDRRGQVLVDDVVAVLEGLDLVAPDVRRVGEVPQVVLDEPQHRVREDVVEAVVGLLLGDHEAHLVLAAGRRAHAERPPLLLLGLARVAVGQGAGDPHRVAVGGQAGEGGHEAARAALDRPVVLERDRPAVGNQDERGSRLGALHARESSAGALRAGARRALRRCARGRRRAGCRAGRADPG